MADLSRSTLVVQLTDGTYMTRCRACKKRWWRERRRVEPTEFDFPAAKFGTRPEANGYLREHEKTAYHALCLSWEANTAPGYGDARLDALFGPSGDGACPKCGGHHKTWVDCDMEPRKR